MSTKEFENQLAEENQLIDTRKLLKQLEELRETEVTMASLSNKFHTIQKQMQILQHKCNHPVVIHYGEQIASKMYGGNVVIGGDFYCVHCGMRNLRISTAKNEKHEHIILEYSTEQYGNSDLKIQEMAKLYKAALAFLPRMSSMDQVLAKLEACGIRHYKASITEW